MDQQSAGLEGPVDAEGSPEKSEHEKDGSCARPCETAWNRPAGPNEAFTRLKLPAGLPLGIWIAAHPAIIAVFARPWNGRSFGIVGRRPPDRPPAPIVGQELLEGVVNGDNSQQVVIGVDHGQGKKFVPLELMGHFLERRTHLH